MPEKKGFPLHEETREVIVVRKKKGGVRREVDSIRVTVRSSRPIGQVNVQEMVEAVFGPKSGNVLSHSSRRHIDKK